MKKQPRCFFSRDAGAGLYRPALFLSSFRLPNKKRKEGGRPELERVTGAKKMNINKENPVPLYLQIKEIWRHQIKAGVLKPGDQFPTEQELCRRYEVSRITVKQAVSALVNEGLLIRRRGKGTFVAKPKLRQDLTGLTSFTEDMKRRGLVPGAKVLKKEIVKTTPFLTKKIDVVEGTEVMLIERVRTADGEPLALESLYIPYDACPQLLHADLELISIYDFLEKEYHLNLEGADQFLEAGLADRKVAKILKIQEGAPVLTIERLSYLADGRRLEYTTSIYRGDKYQFHVAMKRKH